MSVRAIAALLTISYTSEVVLPGAKVNGNRGSVCLTAWIVSASLTFPLKVIRTESSLTEISIYPNPAGVILNIETEYLDHYSIEITSLNGQQILIGEMEGTSHQLDLSSFQKGVYFITIRSEDFVTTRKIIKL